MKQNTWNDMKHVNVNVDLMQVILIINNVGIKINPDLNVKNRLIKVCLTKDFFGILVIV